MERFGYAITYLPVDKNGKVNEDDLRNAITDKTCLISIMTANNEIGTIQSIKDLVKIAKEKNILFHTDAVQAVGKIPVDVEKLGVDLLSFSGHKLYGPKGIGVLYLRKGVKIEPLISGSKQENDLRAGTENVLGIAGLGKAADLAMQRLQQNKTIAVLRDKLENEIKNIFPKAKINGDKTDRLPGTLNLQLPGLRGESIVLAMDKKGIALSSGSACRAGSPKPSSTLLAIGLSEEDAHCSVRFSLGLHTTEEEIDKTIKSFAEVIDEAKNAVRFVSCR